MTILYLQMTFATKMAIVANDKSLQQTPLSPKNK
jgi:hypothetical protein